MEERRIVKNLILLLMLAVSCVAAAELVMCRVMDRDLYERLVEPVRILYHDSRVQVKHLSTEYDRWTAEQEAFRAEAAALQVRHAEERRLLKAMVKDQQALFQYFEEHPFVYTPPAIPRPVTELVYKGGVEWLTGGTAGLTRYFNQHDELWATAPFGVDYVGGYGCGPTALAMAVSTLSDEPANPMEVAAWAGSMGYAAPHSGSHYTIVQGVAEHYGLVCYSISTLTEDALKQALSTGGVAVALMGPGHFTSNGHFILLHGLTEAGQVLVADPNSRERSVVPWDISLVLDELSATRSDGAPLWLITRPG